MFGLFKNKQLPTCKKCGTVAVGLNAEGLCPNCATNSDDVYSTETTYTGGQKIVTQYNKYNDVVSQTITDVTPQQVQQDNVKSGICWHCARPREFVYDNGLCEVCNDFVTADIRRRADIIAESYNIMMSTKNVNTFYSRCKVYTENVNALTDYAQHGINFNTDFVEKIDVMCKDMQKKETSLQQALNSI